MLGPSITECRACGESDLIPILSLGNQYPSNFIDEDFSPNEKDKIPLELVFCGKKRMWASSIKTYGIKEIIIRRILVSVRFE